jgi:CheY-like chemotaxis protein
LKKPPPNILVAADVTSLAERVGGLAAEAFAAVHISAQPLHAARDFETYRPSVLVLAFENLEAARDYRKRLVRSSPAAHALPHRTIVLSGECDLRRAYECCVSGEFDDYVLFWPAMSDAPRLCVAIHHALQWLSSHATDCTRVPVFAAHARRVLEQQPKLVNAAHRFAHEVDLTRAALVMARRSSSAVPLSCQRELDEVHRSVEALCDAARAMAGTLGPYLQAADAMRRLCERVRPTVLAVGDDAIDRRQLADWLAGTNVELISASSGTQAFGSIWTRRPDVVLIDVDLPDVSGIEVTRRLKSAQPLASIPVIMTAGHSPRAVVMASIEAGADDFIVKPFRRATLLDKLGSFLSRSVA